MTASSLSLKEMRTQHARPRRRLMRRVPAILLVLETLLLLALSLAFSGGARAAEAIKGEVNVYTDSGFARLAFRFDREVPASIDVKFPILVVRFKQPVAVDVARLSSASGYISAARLDPDRTVIRIALTNKVKVHTIPAAERLFIDLLPETWVGVMPGAPQEVIDDLARRAREAERQLHSQRTTDKERKPPTIRVRVASQPTFVRYVFDLPEGINVVPEQRDGRFVLNFDRQIKWDLADAVAALPPTLKSIDADTDYDSVAVNFVLNGKPKVRSFHEDRSIAVDVGLDGAPAKQAAAAPLAAASNAPAAVPGIAAPETVPAENAPGETKQVGPPALIDMSAPAPAAPKQAAPAPVMPPPQKTAETLPAVPAEMPKGAAKPAPAAAPPPPPAHEAKAAAAPPPAPKTAHAVRRPASDPNAPVEAELHQSGDGLRIEFPFAAPTPTAVFRRADMLWLVFDSAAEIRLSALRREAGEAIREARFTRSKDGAAIVRLRLARPRLTGVISDGPAWIVEIGDTVSDADQAVGHRPQHRRQEPRQHRHSVRRSAHDPPHRRSRRRRQSDGDHGAGPRARLPQGAGFRRAARAALGAGRGAAAARRRSVRRFVGRQDHHQPAGRALAVADRHRPAAARHLVPRHDLRHPALGLRPQRQLQQAPVRSDPDRRHGAAAKAPRGQAQSRALLSRPRHVGGSARPSST